MVFFFNKLLAVVLVELEQCFACVHSAWCQHGSKNKPPTFALVQCCALDASSACFFLLKHAKVQGNQ